MATTLHFVGTRKRMRVPEPRQRGDLFVQFRVVLHSARTQRIEPVVHAERALGERGEMRRDFRLGKFGQVKFFAQTVGLVVVSLHLKGRHGETASSLYGFFKHGLHSVSSTVPTTSSISALRFISVQHQRMRCSSRGSPPRIFFFSSAAATAYALPGVMVTNSSKNSPS